MTTWLILLCLTPLALSASIKPDPASPLVEVTRDKNTGTHRIVIRTPYYERYEEVQEDGVIVGELKYKRTKELNSLSYIMSKESFIFLSDITQGIFGEERDGNSRDVEQIKRQEAARPEDQNTKFNTDDTSKQNETANTEHKISDKSDSTDKSIRKDYISECRKNHTNGIQEDAEKTNVEVPRSKRSVPEMSKGPERPSKVKKYIRRRSHLERSLGREGKNHHVIRIPDSKPTYTRQ